MKSKNKNLSKQAFFHEGFTLLEVLVALALIGSALLLISRLFSYDLRSLAGTGDYTAAVEAAQQKMREVLAEDHIAEGDSHETVDGRYDMDVSIHPVLEDRTENLNLKFLAVDLTISWAEISGGKQRSFTLNTLKAVAEKP